MAEPLSASSPDVATLERGSIHIARWGRSGPRVVLVHGGVLGSTVGERNFAAQRSLAESSFQFIVPDRPGRGLSPDPGRPDDGRG